MRAQQRTCGLPAGWAPYAVAGDAAGGLWMTVLTPAGLAHLGTEPRAEVVHEPLSAGQPMQLSIGPDAEVWYTRTDDRLGRRDSTGAHTLIDLPAGAAPYGIAATPDGGAWFTAPGSNQLGRVTADATLTLIDLPVPGAGAAMLTVEADGTVWAALNAAGALARVRGDAVRIVELPDGPGPAAPVGVSASPAGIWYADIARGRVGRVDPSGRVEQIRFADETCRPHAVAADVDGGCWVTLWASGELARVSADGAVRVQQLPGREPHGLWVSPTNVWVAMESGCLVVVPR